MTARRWDRTDPALPDGWVWASREALAREYPIPSAFASFQDAVEEGLR